MQIINKNEKPVTIDLQRFAEIGLKGKVVRNIITGEKTTWGNSIKLD